MEENKLRHMDGKKIRRQYFTTPLIVFYSAAIVIVYFVLTILLLLKRPELSEWVSTFWICIWTCFVLSLPLLIFRILNRYCFGRIVCVLTKEGIQYPKGKLCWETIEKIEYAVDTKPRYKRDSSKACRAIIYTRGGKHVVLDKVPLYMVSGMKKLHKSLDIKLDIKITGIASRLWDMLCIAAIMAVCPFYVVVMVKAPGLSYTQWIVFLGLFVVVGIIRYFVFDAYAIQYRFWRRILPKKWLSYIVLGCYYPSFFVILLILFYFPNWVMVSLLGVLIGVVQPPIPSSKGSSFQRRRFMSYEQLCEIYISNAKHWEKNIEKKNAKRAKQKEQQPIE